MSTFGNSTRRIRNETLRVAASTERPGWVNANGQLPSIGDAVHCTEGEAEVVRILGKTGDGSRLLELRLPDRPRQPFFAASSNVLVRGIANGPENR